jgi:hypothetical protein
MLSFGNHFPPQPPFLQGCRLTGNNPVAVDHYRRLTQAVNLDSFYDRYLLS